MLLIVQECAVRQMVIFGSHHKTDMCGGGGVVLVFPLSGCGLYVYGGLWVVLCALPIQIQIH